MPASKNVDADADELALTGEKFGAMRARLAQEAAKNPPPVNPIFDAPAAPLAQNKTLRAISRLAARLGLTDTEIAALFAD